VLGLERAHGRRVGAWLHARQWVRSGQTLNATAQHLRRWDGRECLCLLFSAPRALCMHAWPPQDGVKALLQHIESDSFGGYLDAQQVTPAETIAYTGINGPAGCALLFLLARQRCMELCWCQCTAHALAISEQKHKHWTRKG
jgi:hypothetical protein